MNPIVSQYFSHLADLADDDISLAEAVLHIAVNEYPQLDIGEYLAKLDAMAVELRPALERDAPALSIIGSLNDYLFRQHGFSGNWRHFNDPRNSFLNDVLDRKLGIPISLSLLYVEIGRRLGLAVSGVSFPGHFLVKFTGDEDFIIDPFAGGLVLDESDLLERLQLFDGQSVGSGLEDLLRSASKREILMRFLRNLKYIYIDSEDYHRALAVSSLQLMLDPDSPDGLRDRGGIYEKLECYRAASEDFERFLLLNPEASDFQKISRRLAGLQRSINRLH